MLIDTHCHLDFSEFDNDRESVIERAIENDVKVMIDVGTDMDSSIRAVGLARRYRQIYASVGIHPHNANTADIETVEQIRRLAREEKVVAIGEIGLDYYRSTAPRDLQKRIFRTFLRVAKESKLPVIVHNRQADEDIFAIICEELDETDKVVMHCFSGDYAFLRRCLDAGFFVSFTPNITFKNARRLRSIVAKTPLERLFLETDAPFMAPQAQRGYRSEPSYLSYLADEVARIKNEKRATVEDTTTGNAISFFGLKDD